MTIFNRLFAAAAVAVTALVFSTADAQTKISAGTSIAAAQETFVGDICGNQVNLVLKVPGPDANPALRQFFGVWAHGKWDNNACTGLAVTEINGDLATIVYFYGAGSNSPSQPPGFFTKTDAVMKGKQLFFKSRVGYPVYYELTGEGKLKGWFSAIRMVDHLQKLK